MRTSLILTSMEAERDQHGSVLGVLPVLAEGSDHANVAGCLRRDRG
jgi:hypothetical protein